MLKRKEISLVQKIKIFQYNSQCARIVGGCNGKLSCLLCRLISNKTSPKLEAAQHQCRCPILVRCIGGCCL